jgi:PAS domain S-box-containing protein
MQGVAEQILGNSPDVIVRFDREARHLYVNPAIIQWIDSPLEKILGKTHRELGFDEKDCVFYENAIGGVFASGMVTEHEIVVPTRQGQRIFNWRLIPECDGGRQVKSVLGVARDITEHRLTECDLRRMFAEMVDGFALHEIICDQEGIPVDYRFLSVNPTFEKLTGLTASQVVGRRVLDVLPATEPYWVETYGKVALTREPTHFEHYSKGLDRHFEVKAYSPEPGRFACMFSDITERKRMETSHARMLAKEMLRLQRKLGIAGRVEEDNQAVYDYMLASIVELTDSDYGYIYFYSEETELFTLHAWSDRVLNACAIVEPQSRYTLSQTGFWGEVVRQRKSIINNEFSASHPWKRGYPEGHAPILRFMSVPIVEGEKIVAVAGVANKVDPYTEQDALGLQEFSQFIWSVIRQRLEHQKVKEERMRFEALGEASFGGVFMHDQVTILDCNGKLSDITGYDYQELVGMKVLELIAPECVDTVSANVRDGYDQTYEVVGVRKDGSRYPLAIQGKTIFYQGRAIRVGEFQDITERKEAEAKREQDQQLLRERKEFIKAIISSTTEAIFGLDSDGRCIFINQAAQQMLGYEAGQLIGQPAYELIAQTAAAGSSAGEEGNILRKVMVSGAPHHVADGVFWRNDGGCVNVDYIVRPIVRNEHVYGVVVSFNDVSEKKKQIEQRIRSGQLASLGELATGMAHEINNPITGVINCAQLLMNKHGQHDYENKILSMIIKEGNRISSIVNNLLVFAHRDRDKMAPLDIKSVIDEPLLLTEQQLINDGVYCDIDVADKLPRIYGNCQRLEQVMLNLISNARYALNSRYPASDPNKILRISAREVVRGDGRKIELTVYDQGCGIPKQIIEKVFNSFFTTKPAGEGTGLGLSIIHDIIEEHGATIDIESDFGLFTKVIMEFPVYSPAST